MGFEVLYVVVVIVLGLLAVWAGRQAVFSSLGARRSALGILIDERERFSLNRLQTVLWTVLIAATFVTLFLLGLGDPAARAAAFDIPPNLLILMGISAGTATVAGAVKDGKNATRPHKVAGSADFLADARATAAVQQTALAAAPASTDAAGSAGAAALSVPAAAMLSAAPAPSPTRPRFAQVVLEEEGQNADQIVSVTKFQSFLLTLTLAAVYLALLVTTGTYPVFSDEALWLLGISHAGYVGGKVPDKA